MKEVTYQMLLDELEVLEDVMGLEFSFDECYQDEIENYCKPHMED